MCGASSVCSTLKSSVQQLPRVLAWTLTALYSAYTESEYLNHLSSCIIRSTQLRLIVLYKLKNAIVCSFVVSLRAVFESQPYRPCLSFGGGYMRLCRRRRVRALFCQRRSASRPQFLQRPPGATSSQAGSPRSLSVTPTFSACGLCADTFSYPKATLRCPSTHPTALWRSVA